MKVGTKKERVVHCSQPECRIIVGRIDELGGVTGSADPIMCTRCKRITPEREAAEALVSSQEAALAQQAQPEDALARADVQVTLDAMEAAGHRHTPYYKYTLGTVREIVAAALRAVFQPTRKQIAKWFALEFRGVETPNQDDYDRADAVLALYGKSEAEPNWRAEVDARVARPDW